MIKTFLPANFATKAELSSIYEDLAKKILGQMKPYPLKCQYEGKDFPLDSKENIRQFLTAEDFDSYRFSPAHRFLSGALSLRPQTKIKTIVETQTPKKLDEASRPVERFRYIYQGSEYCQWYTELEAIFNLHPDWNINNFKGNLTSFPWTEEYRTVDDAFSYDSLTDSARHIILTSMDIPVCPYCNIDYTLNYEKKGQQRSTADLDHFYLKSEYPEYSLCLYNFVPSCPVCNSKMKGTKSMTRTTHLYPHSRETDYVEKEVRFEIQNMASFLLGKNRVLDLELCIDPDAKQKNKIEANEQVFQLNSRYQNFQWYAEEWLKKAQIYNSYYEDELKKWMIHSSIDIKELIFGYSLSEQEYGRRSLGKLKNDLLIQFGIFEDPDDDSR